MKSQCFIILGLIILFFVSCEKIVEPDQQNETQPAPLLLQFSLASAPQAVDSIVGKIERDGYDTIEKTFSITGDTASADFGQIASGPWQLTVNAYSENGLLIYSGNTTVYVQPGIVNHVYLNLNPVTGELIVTVTWGIPDYSNKLLFYGTERFGQISIYSMNFDGSALKKISHGMHPVWNEDKTKMSYQTYPGTIVQSSPGGLNPQIIVEIPFPAIHILRSGPLNSLLFYYAFENTKNMGMMNLSTTYSSIISEREFREVLPQTTNTSDWVYYLNGQFENNSIYKMKPDGTVDQPVIIEDYNIGAFAFSKDARYLVYSITNSSVSQLVVFDLNTDQSQRFDFTSQGQVNWPAFSPEGNYIFYVMSMDDASTFNTSYERAVFRMDSDGTNVVQLTYDYYIVEHVRPIAW